MRERVGETFFEGGGLTDDLKSGEGPEETLLLVSLYFLGNIFFFFWGGGRGLKPYVNPIWNSYSDIVKKIF